MSASSPCVAPGGRCHWSLCRKLYAAFAHKHTLSVGALNRTACDAQSDASDTASEYASVDSDRTLCKLLPIGDTTWRGLSLSLCGPDGDNTSSALLRFDFDGVSIASSPSPFAGRLF